MSKLELPGENAPWLTCLIGGMHTYLLEVVLACTRATFLWLEISLFLFLGFPNMLGWPKSPFSLLYKIKDIFYFHQ